MINSYCILFTAIPIPFFLWLVKHCQFLLLSIKTIISSTPALFWCPGLIGEIWSCLCVDLSEGTQALPCIASVWGGKMWKIHIYQKLTNKSADATSWKPWLCMSLLYSTDSNDQCGQGLLIPGTSWTGDFATSFCYIDTCAGMSRFSLLRPSLQWENVGSEVGSGQ